MVALSNACFEFADEVPEDVQHGSHLHALLEVAVVRLCALVSFRLLSLLPCCVHISLHTRARAPTLCSARALRAPGQFGLSGKHHFDYVDGYVTDAVAIEDWW